jgi:hypothetical protein
LVTGGNWRDGGTRDKDGFDKLPPIDAIHLTKQHLAAVVIPPSIKIWTAMCREAPDEELLRLRSMALKSLYADGGENQRWAIYVSVAQDALRDRGIKP